jgi:hypothetical protein
MAFGKGHIYDHSSNCADHLGLTANLTLADVHGTWNAEGDYDCTRRRRHHWYDGEVAGDEVVAADDYELKKLIEDEIILRHWITRSEHKIGDRDTNPSPIKVEVETEKPKPKSEDEDKPPTPPTSPTRPSLRLV